MNEQNHEATRTLVIVHAGTSDPSSTRLLADRIASRTAALAGEQGVGVRIRTIDLRVLANDVTSALTSQLVSPELQKAIELLQRADGIVASTPVYKAGPSGLFTGFFQTLDNDLLIGVPVVLAATGGSSRHALVIDDQLRGPFAYLRTLTAPTSVFAAPEDWQGGSLGKRIDRAASELALMMQSDFAAKLRDASWGSYQHSFGSAASVAREREALEASLGAATAAAHGAKRGVGTELGIDLDSDLMKMATGGR